MTFTAGLKKRQLRSRKISASPRCQQHLMSLNMLKFSLLKLSAQHASTQFFHTKYRLHFSHENQNSSRIHQYICKCSNLDIVSNGYCFSEAIKWLVIWFTFLVYTKSMATFSISYLPLYDTEFVWHNAAKLAIFDRRWRKWTVASSPLG